MATGKQSDFVLYHEQFYGGQIEVMAQNTVGFNAASAGALTLVAKALKGEYEKESFLQYISNVITRRDLTSVADVADLAMTMEELISVKVNRKIGPVGQTLNSWRKIGKDSKEMSLKLGRLIAVEKLGDYLNTLIKCVEAALEGQTALNYDATGQTTKTLTHTHLVSGLNLMGDRSSRIVCWVMHSKPWHDLMKQSIADKITNVADAVIYKGTPATLNRPTVVTDAPALTDANGSATDTYNILGLVRGAAGVVESEAEDIEFQVVTGKEQLIGRLQGEYAFNVGVKGFQWDVTNGAGNPTDATLATTTNWDKVANDNKDLAGVRIKTQ